MRPVCPGFSSKFLMGGGETHNFWSPSVPDGDEVRWGGGTCEKNLTEAKTAQLMQNLAIFCYFKHEIQLFKVLLSLKVVKFDTKMYLNLSNIWGRTSAGGKDKPWSKNGDKCWMGGLTKFSPDGGTPQSPPKNPGTCVCPVIHCMFRHALMSHTDI